jgi:hypothetical protein
MDKSMVDRAQFFNERSFSAYQYLVSNINTLNEFFTHDFFVFNMTTVLSEPLVISFSNSKIKVTHLNELLFLSDTRKDKVYLTKTDIVDFLDTLFIVEKKYCAHIKK